MKKSTLILIILLSIFGTPALSQQYLSRQIDYANNLFESRLYYEAITEFKRLLFFDKNSIYDYDVNFKIGQSYKKGAKFDEAIKFFFIAAAKARTSHEAYNAKIEIIRTNILRKTTARALALLSELEKNEEYKSQIHEINYWRGWSYMFANDWERASQAFRKVPYAIELKMLCDSVENAKYSVTFAKVISYILPGSGQFYTEDYLSGLMSLSWNILWGYLTINSFAEERVFDGLVIGNLLWFRFYRGNYQNAEKYTEQKNIEIANKALRNLQYNYQGIKP